MNSVKELEPLVQSYSIYCPPTLSDGSMIHRGLFAVFKPSGITSAETVSRIKQVIRQSCDATSPIENEAKPKRTDPRSKYLRAKKQLKVGHGGTLDMLAEGVLVIGVGEDCKKLTGYLKGRKIYEAIGELGKITDTLDSSGVVTAEKAFGHIRKIDIENILQHFEGEISQIPPAYSALKQNQIRLSDLARRGILVSPPPRQVCIYFLSLLDFKPPHFKIRVECSSGTYIRSLLRDIGQKLDSEAYMTYLCRTQQGPFTLDDALREHEWTVENILRVVRRATV